MELTLYHGGKDLEDTYDDIRSSKAGQWEHGPGLYLTNQFDTAQKYSKGKGFYKVTINFDPKKSMDNIKVSLDKAIAFVKAHVKSAKRSEVIEMLEQRAVRAGGNEIPIAVVNNLCLNLDALTTAKTAELAKFLIDNGVQYASTRYGGRDETVIVVIDRSIIKKVQRVKPSTIDTDDYTVPVNLKESFSGFLSRQIRSPNSSLG